MPALRQYRTSRIENALEVAPKVAGDQQLNDAS
jgi:hypothetical protein